MEEEIIVEVEKHPCLYDLSLAEYKDFVTKENIWQEISKKVGLKGETI